jgi:TPP-dependent pyruvate/acetoin dehydrogenase alpha subunit
MDKTKVDNELYQNLYESLYRIRRVEEQVADIYTTDKIKSPVHLSIGQEAVSVGVCAALEPDDYVFGTYRGHALYLAKGGDVKKMIAELYGKVTGCAKGKGGSMHLVDVSKGVMGTSAVVGTTIPNAVGYALAMQYQKKPNIVVSFFGDGAVEEGVFTESLNFAVLKKLPIIFVCENNNYAIHSQQCDRQAVNDIIEQVRPYGLPVNRILGNDVLALRACISSLTDKMRQQQTGPVFVECMTSRWLEHVGPSEDFHLGYRSADKAQSWIDDDQLIRLAHLISEEKRTAIEKHVEAEIGEAFDFAESSPFPDENELYTEVFKVG